MELFTVTLEQTDTLFSIPVNQLQGFGETQQDVGFIVVGGIQQRVKEDYLTLMDMYRDLTGTGE